MDIIKAAASGVMLTLMVFIFIMLAMRLMVPSAHAAEDTFVSSYELPTIYPTTPSAGFSVRDQIYVEFFFKDGTKRLEPFDEAIRDVEKSLETTEHNSEDRKILEMLLGNLKSIEAQLDEK